MAQPPADVVEYLKSTFITSIRHDFEPVLVAEEGGYFSIPRLVFCAVEYLGRIYCASRSGGKDSEKGVVFLQEVMKEVDEGYGTHSKELFDMLRHGTVHQYSPKKYLDTNSRSALGWLAYRGRRKDLVKVHFSREPILVTHLRWFHGFDEGDYSHYFLPASIHCLYEDLLWATFRLVEKLSNDHRKKDSAQKVYDELEKTPIKVNQAWWLTKNERQ